MALIVGHNGSSKTELVANRTEQSKGSVGGNKKAGIWGGHVYMGVRNIGNKYTYRIPQRVPTLVQMQLFSTRNPTQIRRGSPYATHSGILG